MRMTTLLFAMGTVIITASLGVHPGYTRANETCAMYTTRPGAPPSATVRRVEPGGLNEGFAMRELYHRRSLQTSNN